MDATYSLKDVLSTVLETGKRVELTPQLKEQFYSDFFDKISPQIEELKERQRKAYEDNKTLAVG